MKTVWLVRMCVGEHWENYSEVGSLDEAFAAKTWLNRCFPGRAVRLTDISLRRHLGQPVPPLTGQPALISAAAD